MKKLNVYITTAEGKIIILTNVTSGQYRAIGDALDAIYPGASIVALAADEKPSKFNVNKVLQANGYNKFGDFVGLDGSEDVVLEEEDDTDEDGAQASDAAAASAAIPEVIMDFKPTIGTPLA